MNAAGGGGGRGGGGGDGDGSTAGRGGAPGGAGYEGGASLGASQMQLVRRSQSSVAHCSTRAPIEAHCGLTALSHDATGGPPGSSCAQLRYPLYSQPVLFHSQKPSQPLRSPMLCPCSWYRPIHPQPSKLLLPHEDASSLPQSTSSQSVGRYSQLDSPSHPGCTPSHRPAARQAAAHSVALRW